MNLIEQSLATDHHYTTYGSIKRAFNGIKSESHEFPISEIVKKCPKTGEALLNIHKSKKGIPLLDQFGMTKVHCGDNNNKEKAFSINQEQFFKNSREQFASFLIPFANSSRYLILFNLQYQINLILPL